MFLIVNQLNQKAFLCNINMNNRAPVEELNLVYSRFRISVATKCLYSEIVTVVTINSERIAELDVIKQAEERITNCKVIALAEKVKPPATVQVLLCSNLAVLRLDVNITTAPSQISNRRRCQIVLYLFNKLRVTKKALTLLNVFVIIGAFGEVSERFKELVLKTSDVERHRGFESHPLRHESEYVTFRKYISSPSGDYF